MNSFSDRLKTALTEKGLSQSELSRISGVARNSISDYIKDKYEAKQDKVFLLAKALNVNEAWLMGYDVPRERIIQPVNTEKKNEITVFVDNKYQESGIVNMPHYPSVAAGTLAEMESVDVWNVKNISIPSFLLGEYSSNSNLFAMTVNGDSMNNIIPDHSLIVVKPMEDYSYKDGDIVVFSYNNEYSLKIYRPDLAENSIIFEPDSTDSSFKKIVISKDEFCNACLFGKVIFSARTF